MDLFVIKYPRIVVLTHSLTHSLGDGNQDIIDNKFCINWEESLEKEEYVFESLAFPGVEHMQMVADDEVNSAIFAIIESYL